MPIVKASMLAAIQARGLIRVTVDYSADRTRGGINWVTGLFPDGRTLPLGATTIVTERWDRDAKAMAPITPEVEEAHGMDVRRRTASPDDLSDHALYKTLVAPIFEEWGDFSDDTVVNGQYVYDVAANEIKKTQQVETISATTEEETW
jgi:hypothetical protein